MPLHERLRERFAGLETGGRSGGTKEPEAGGLEAIGDAQAQRKLGTDDREIDVFARSQCDEFADVLNIRRNRADKARNPRIPGRANDTLWAKFGCQTRHKRVLARTAAENENPHWLSELGRKTISLTLRGFAA
jgi:hypothetical protein